MNNDVHCEIINLFSKVYLPANPLIEGQENPHVRLPGQVNFDVGQVKIEVCGPVIR